MLKRGDIVLIRNDERKCTGSEFTKDRPAVVVSNDSCNKFSPVIEVVFTTTSPRKKLLPTHVIMNSTPAKSVVLCEAIHSVDKSRILEHIGWCTDDEIRKINRALAVSIGLVVDT